LARASAFQAEGRGFESRLPLLEISCASPTSSFAEPSGEGGEAVDGTELVRGAARHSAHRLRSLQLAGMPRVRVAGGPDGGCPAGLLARSTASLPPACQPRMKARPTKFASQTGIRSPTLWLLATRFAGSDPLCGESRKSRGTKSPSAYGRTKSRIRRSSKIQDQVSGPSGTK
jgi:hypothetical protein